MLRVASIPQNDAGRPNARGVQGRAPNGVCAWNTACGAQGAARRTTLPPGPHAGADDSTMTSPGIAAHMPPEHANIFYPDAWTVTSPRDGGTEQTAQTHGAGGPGGAELMIPDNHALIERVGHRPVVRPSLIHI